MKKSYDNGVPKEIGTYKLSNDKLALVKKTYFYNNGQNKEEGSYLNGKKHGTWTAWYKNGNKKSKTTFLNGKSDGKSTVWSPDGKESFELIWKRGKKFDGIWTNWYNNGQKESKGAFDNGIPIGIYTYWYENGQKESEGTYIGLYRGITKHGKWTHWYENGPKKEELTYREGKKYGIWTNWYNNGQKELEGAYKDGIPTGRNTYWYENGNKKGLAYIINGLPTDEKCWDEEGKECECEGYYWEGCIGSALVEMDNPCNDGKYLQLIKIAPDKLSKKQHDYLSKKENECAEYKSQQIAHEKEQQSKNKKQNTRHRKQFGIPYILSLYASYPGIKLTSVKNYGVYEINGIFIETPLRFNIGKLKPYLILEYRNYNFKNSDQPNFGGSAFVGGLKASIKLLKGWFKPNFSILTGKFHAGPGIIIDAGIPLLKIPNSPFILNSSVRINLVQKEQGGGTGWLDYGLFIGYPIYF